jgi:hypothetical protein
MMPAAVARLADIGRFVVSAMTSPERNARATQVNGGNIQKSLYQYIPIFTVELLIVCGLNQFFQAGVIFIESTILFGKQCRDLTHDLLGTLR